MPAAESAPALAPVEGRPKFAAQTMIQFAPAAAPQDANPSGSTPATAAPVHNPLASTQVSPLAPAGSIAPAPGGLSSAKKTMIGVSMSEMAQTPHPPLTDGAATAPMTIEKGPMVAPAEPIAAAGPFAHEAGAHEAGTHEAGAHEAGAMHDGGASPNLRVSASKTMLGVAMPGIAPIASTLPSHLQPTAQPPAAQPQLSQPATMPESPAARSKTMLGVAMPGIAPVREPDPNAPGAAPSMNRGGTMMGVAVPGIAPIHPGVASNAAFGQAPPYAPPQAHVRGKLANTAISQAPIVPMPPPFVEDEGPAPSAPRKREKRGVPIGVVAAIIGGLVLVGGGIIAALYRGSAPITAQPRLDAQGNEELHLRCDNCKDGTVVELDGAKGTFSANEADLPLTKSLDVGDNAITLHVDRPGVGRDETVKLVVPVAFRIRADLANIGAKPPVITVRVTAAPATDVTVDGKPLALDPSGKGAYALDVSADTEGLTDQLRVIDRKIPYTVTVKGGKAESGVVSARVAVVPIRLDGPSSHAIIDQPSFVLGGQTSAGATVTLNDKAVTVNPDGTFAQPFDAKALGEIPIEIRASAPSRAPRTAHVTVKHVASLEIEAKAAEAQSPLTYDAINADIASKVGQRAVIAGEVVDARVVGHQMIALIDDHRGCAQKGGQCLARVLTGEDARIAKGDTVRAYGRVLRAVTASNGKVVPEIEGDFVVKGRGPR